MIKFGSEVSASVSQQLSVLVTAIEIFPLQLFPSVFQALETPASISQPVSPAARGLTHLLGVHLSQEMGKRLGVLWLCAHEKPQNKMTGVPLSCEHPGWEGGAEEETLTSSGGWVRGSQNQVSPEDLSVPSNAFFQPTAL